MAAPCRAWRFFQVGHVLRTLEKQPCLASCQLLQVRHKKGAGRYKAPPVDKDKDKWVPRASRQSSYVEKVMPKNWQEKIMTRVPQDDVWIRKFYPRPKYTFESVISKHREYAQPTMLNNMDGFIYVDMELDMRTKKKTKFLSDIKKTVVLPCPFDDGTDNRVLALCKKQEDKDIAVAMGAVYAGGLDLIKSIEKGEIHPDEYDHVVCTIDIYPDITGIRKYMRDTFPHQQKSSLSSNMEAMMRHFTEGRSYESSKLNEAIASLQVVVGRLSQPMEELVANFTTYIEDICSNRPPDLGPFITKAFVLCPPSVEKFQLEEGELLSSALRNKHKAKQQAAQEREMSDTEEESEELQATVS